MNRPKKPRITKPRLTWKWNQSKNLWEPFHRVSWSEDGKRKQKAILLKWGGDARKLDALYWACESGRHDRQILPPKYSWDALILEWRSDPRVQGKLAASTKASYRRDMDRIKEKNGSKDVRRTTRQAVRAAHTNLAATPRKADKFLSVISLLWNYALNKLDWPIGKNPAAGIDHFGKKSEWQPWPDWMIDKLPTAPQNVQTAARLILNTGQRPGAAIRMRRDQFQGEWMKVLDEKSDEYFETYCPRELREYVQHLPRTGQHILAKNLTEPLGYDAVEKTFRAWRTELGETARPFVLHGLRKLAIVRLAEAGATDAEIQAITNQSAEMVAYYRKRASRKIMSKNAQNRTKTKRDV